ncbi:hypothetical protein AB7M17_000805 [Bradyrhizobium sp. USDA 377]
MQAATPHVFIFQRHYFGVITMLRGPARTIAAILTLLGVVALALCLAGIAFDLSWLRSGTAAQAPADDFCTIENAALKDPKDPRVITLAEPDDANGKLRVVNVFPRTVTFGSRLCVVVAGVASQAGENKLKKDVDDDEKKIAELKKQLDGADDKTKPEIQKKIEAANVDLAAAKAAQNQPRPTVEVTLFLNGRRSPMTLRASSTPTAQALAFELGETPDAASDAAKFWRSLVASKTNSGLMTLKIGLSRSQSNSPEAEDKGTIDFRLYWTRLLALGATSVALLFAGFAIFAAQSSILRDHSLTYLQIAEQRVKIAKAALAQAPGDADLTAAANDANAALQTCRDSTTKNEAGGTFSLGRTQMALWLWLSTAGFIFIWLTLGIYRNVITEAILILLGINSVTGLAAVILDRDDDPKNPRERFKSQGFWTDLLSDEDGPKLHRIQMIGWTAILAIIFTWNVVANFIFVEFDTNLLLLMGIVNSTYLGFKTQENKYAKK